MHKNTRCSLGLIALLVGLSGCVQRQLLNDGADFMAHGRYELAVVRYREAVRRDASDAQAQASLERAQAQLDQWLDSVRQAADQAYAQGEQGKAMLLYGKLADLRHDPRALQRYRELHGQLTQRYGYRVQLAYDGRDFGPDLGGKVPGLGLHSSAHGESQPTLQIRISRSPAQIRVDERERIEHARYVAGQRSVPNPEFREVQARVAQRREKMHIYRERQQHLNHHYREAHKDLDTSNEELQGEQKDLDAAGEGNREYARLEKQVAQTKEHVKQTNKRLNELHRQIEKNAKRLRHLGKKLDRDVDALLYLAPVIEQDVYADYDYPVRVVTQTASTTIQIEQGGRVREIPVQVDDVVEAHDAHALIGLGELPVRLKPEARMLDELDAQARAQAETALSEVAQAYRYGWLQRARESADSDQRLEFWVAYGVSGDHRISTDLARRIRAQLELEMGRGGEFDPQRLLNLYP